MLILRFYKSRREVNFMSDFEIFSMIVMILTLVIAAYKLGKDSTK